MECGKVEWRVRGMNGECAGVCVGSAEWVMSVCRGEWNAFVMFLQSGCCY